MNILKDLNQRQREVEISLLIFFISFVVYLKTLCPTIYIGDSGELIAAAYCLGIPHPPGYPLYCLLGKLFTLLIPWGNIALRINIMSAFFASVSLVLFYHLLCRFHLSQIIAFSASLFLAFSASFWSQAVIAEVYTLNAFFFILILLFLQLWSQKQEKRYLYLLALIYGLSITNHYTLLFLVPGIIFFLLSADRNIFKKRGIFPLMAGLFLLGLTPFIYLPLRSLADPPIDWGNPENWHNFLIHVTRAQYGEWTTFSASGEFFWKKLFSFVKFLAQQVPVFIEIFGLLGLYFLLRRNRRWFFTSCLFFLFTILGVTSFLNLPIFYYHTKHYFPAYIVFILWLGYGMQFIVEKVRKTRWSRGFGIIFLLLPLIFLTTNYFQSNRSTHYFAYDLGMNILKTLEQDAVLFTQGDVSTFSLAYLTVVEEKRPDVVIYHRDGSLFPDIYGFKEMDFDQETKEERQTRVEKEIITSSKQPIYYEEERDMTSIPGYILRPAGLLYQIAKEKEPEKLRDYWKEYRVRGINNKSIFKDDETRNIISWYHSHWQQHYLKEKL